MKKINALLEKPWLAKLIIERRRRINGVKGYYPEAFFLSKKRSKKKYCVVRYGKPTFAIMAAGIQYVFCYYKLIEKGYIPIIDIEDKYSFEQGRIGESNEWDWCFEQPILACDLQKQPYVLATGTFFDYSDDSKVANEINGDCADHFIHTVQDNYKEYYAKIKTYTDPIWRVKQDLIEELKESVWNRVAGKRILGVFMREEFSNSVMHKNVEVYNNHPLLPTVEEVIQIIDGKKEWNYDFIYLSTCYQDSVEVFREHFGDKVLYIEKNRILLEESQEFFFEMNDEELYERAKKIRMSERHNTVTYIQDIVALSWCDYLLGGPSSGMAASLVMNGGKYDDIYVLEDIRKIKRY